MNFEAVLHYKHQNQVRDEKKKLRHASGASANSEASNSDSEVDSTDQSPVPSPGQKKVSEVGHKKGSFVFHQLLSVIQKCTQQINKIFKGFWKNVTYHFEIVLITSEVFQSYLSAVIIKLLILTYRLSAWCHHLLQHFSVLFNTAQRITCGHA